MYNRGRPQQPQRLQEKEGQRAGVVVKGKTVPLSAMDFSGRELPLYMEKQNPSCSGCGKPFGIRLDQPIPHHNNPPCSGSGRMGRPPDKDPAFYCAKCGNAKLEDLGIIGANSARKYRCPGCKVEWKRADNLYHGIGMEMT